MSEPSPLLAPLKPETVASRLWRDGRFVADHWRHVADEAPLPIDGHAIVSLKRWRAEQAAIAASGAPVGVVVAAGDSIDPASDDIGRLGVVALAFPKFSDGRAYSTARRLREAGFAGEVRATGDVLLDQLPLMLRAGFDAFEITNAATERALERGELPAVSHVYQSGTTVVEFGWKARRAAGPPAPSPRSGGEPR